MYGKIRIIFKLTHRSSVNGYVCFGKRHLYTWLTRTYFNEYYLFFLIVQVRWTFPPTTSIEWTHLKSIMLTISIVHLIFMLNFATEPIVCNKPVIGVLTQDVYLSTFKVDDGPLNHSYIAASYVKTIEAYGERARPVFIATERHNNTNRCFR